MAEGWAGSDQIGRWSQAVGRRSAALDLEPGVFTWLDPACIAASLLHSAERSARRKRSPYASAMAMLCFYINRAGRALPPQTRLRLEQAKVELRRLAERNECPQAVELSGPLGRAWLADPDA